MDREQLGAWAMEARIFMRGSIEGLALVPPGIVIEHQDVGAGRILVSGCLARPDHGISGRHVERVALLVVGDAQGGCHLRGHVEDRGPAGPDAQKKHLQAQEQQHDAIVEARQAPGQRCNRRWMRTASYSLMVER